MSNNNLKTIEHTANKHNILHNSGYFMRHFDLCLTCKSGEEAYEILESEYKTLAESLKLPKTSKFSSYESFRVAKTNYYKNNR